MLKVSVLGSGNLGTHMVNLLNDSSEVKLVQWYSRSKIDDQEIEVTNDITMLKNAEFIDKLRSSGLRPTKQRLKICELLFNREKTFHFTINDLAKNISDKLNEKISLATVYNTVHAFKDKGYLKEISINSDKSYFDTNITDHPHFFDEDINQLIDCDHDDIDKINIKKNITGKKIKSIEVLIKVASDNQNQN